MRELNTYSVAWNATAVVGTTLEIINPSNSAREIRIVAFVYAVAAATQIHVFRSLATKCTGGTSTSPTPVRRHPNNPPSVATVKLYSAAPTAGSREETVHIISHTGSAFQHQQHAMPAAQPITLPPGYSLEVQWTVGTSTQATIVWTEA